MPPAGAAWLRLPVMQVSPPSFQSAGTELHARMAATVLQAKMKYHTVILAAAVATQVTGVEVLHGFLSDVQNMGM